MQNRVNALAAKLADAYYRETEQRKIKWHELAPQDRSLWRLIARAAIQHQQEATNVRIR